MGRRYPRYLGTERLNLRLTLPEMPYNISIAPDFACLCPDFSLAVIEAKVRNKPTDHHLKQEMDRLSAEILLTTKIEEIKTIPSIRYTRAAYKLCGKDPNRYRPAAEQLLRRIIKGLGIYYVNQLVDLGNIVSLTTGYSLGVFDADRVLPEITLRIGTKDDLFEGIGRGLLNVEGLPIYHDANGPFATPTSDSERSKVVLSTTNTLIFINNYIPQKEEGLESLHKAVELTKNLLFRFVGATDISSKIISFCK